MGLFGSNNPLNETLNKLCNESNTTEDTDWGVVLELCDKIKEYEKGPQDFTNAIFNKLNNKVPHISMQALTVLDAVVQNCGAKFYKEMASQNFTDLLRDFLTSYKNQKCVNKMKFLVRKWAEEFKNDPNLAHFLSIYYYLKGEGHKFPSDDETDVTSKKMQLASSVTNNPDAAASQQEAEDLAKALAASLQDQEKSKARSSPVTSSLYPSMAGTSNGFSSSYTTSNSGAKSKRLVKALYDFEAAEDNELTFHTGDIIEILNDSDPNWWKGEMNGSAGLFPSNFVTSDLNKQVEPEVVQAKQPEAVEEVQPEKVLYVDEALIDKTLSDLQNIDPESTTKDPAEMLKNEEACLAMESLVIDKLDKIDAEHLGLTKLHSDMISALELYNKLMTEAPAPSYHPQMMNYGYQYNPQYTMNQGGVLPSQQQMGGMQYNYQPNNMYQQQPPQAQMQMQYQQPAMQQYQQAAGQQLNYQQQMPAQQVPNQQMQAQQVPAQQMNDQQMNNQQQQMQQIPNQQQHQGYNQANYYTNQTTTQANPNLSSLYKSEQLTSTTASYVIQTTTTTQLHQHQ